MTLDFMKKYKRVLLYLIFGVLSTLVNIGVYALCYRFFGFTNVISNIIAWVLTVLFVFVTNKNLVFGSKSMEKQVLVYELVTFYGCRIATGLLDLAMMYIFVDLLSLNALGMKVISNVIVIILNFIASKLVIFRKHKGS